LTEQLKCRDSATEEYRSETLWGSWTAEKVITNHPSFYGLQLQCKRWSQDQKQSSQASWGGGGGVASSFSEFKKLTQKGQKEFRITDQKQKISVCRSAPVWR
jgi:hypothetical protein